MLSGRYPGSFLFYKEVGIDMNIIETNQLTKAFKRYKKKEGLRGSIQGLWKREYEEKVVVNHIDDLMDVPIRMLKINLSTVEKMNIIDKRII